MTLTNFETQTTLSRIMGVTSINVQLKTSGLSQLVSRVEVYDAWQRLVASKTATDPMNGDLTVTVGGIRLGMTGREAVELMLKAGNVSAGRS